MNNPIVGPFLPNPGQKTVYCLDSDESSMIRDESQLSLREIEEDARYVKDNSAFSLSVLSITTADDVLIIDAGFKRSQELLNWMRNMYERMGLSVLATIVFCQVKQYAKTTLALMNEKQFDLVSVIGYSHLLKQYFSIEKELAASINLNLKTNLVTLAERYGFSIPDSSIVHISDLRKVLESKNFPEKPVYIKADGLGGGSNVMKLQSWDDCKKAESIFDSQPQIMLQEAVDAEAIETITTCKIFSNKVEVINTRAKLVSDGVWYGNVYLPELKLNQRQRDCADRVGKAALEEGYASNQGTLMGLDGFITRDELLVTEINARWLGSTPTEQLLKRLGLLGKVEAVSFFDYVAEDEIATYRTFVEENLYQAEKQKSFALVPMSFSAYPENGQQLFYNLVIGNFTDFYQSVTARFSKKSFTSLDHTLSLYSKNKHFFG